MKRGIIFFSVCMGNFVVVVATLDLRLAVYRGKKNSTHERLLHSIYRDKSLHHIRYSNRRILRACFCDDHTILADMEGDQEATKRSSVLASRKTGCQ